MSKNYNTGTSHIDGQNQPVLLDTWRNE